MSDEQWKRPDAPNGEARPLVEKGQMYLWVDREMATIWMDCPDLGCKDAIALGATPNIAYINEVARDHVRSFHRSQPGSSVVDDQTT